MSIRLLQAIFLSGVYTAVDGATLTLDASLEADLVGQGKAQWVKTPGVKNYLVEHAAAHEEIGLFDKRSDEAWSSTCWLYAWKGTNAAAVQYGERQLYVPIKDDGYYFGAFFGDKLLSNSVVSLTDTCLARTGLSTKSTGLTYSSGWTASTNAAAFDSDYSYANTAGKTVSFSADGTAMAVRVFLAINGGYGVVAIDGDYSRADHLPEFTQEDYAAGRCRLSDIGKRYISCYATSSYSECQCLADDLPSGTHTVQIETTGTKPSASSDYRFYVEAMLACDGQTAGDTNVHFVPIFWINHNVFDWSAQCYVVRWAPSGSSDYQFLGENHADNTNSREVTTALAVYLDTTDHTALAAGSYASGYMARIEHTSTLRHKADLTSPVATKRRIYTAYPHRAHSLMCDCQITWSVAGGIVNIEYPVMLMLSERDPGSVNQRNVNFKKAKAGGIDVAFGGLNDDSITYYPTAFRSLSASGEKIVAFASVLTEHPDRASMATGFGAAYQDRSYTDEKLYVVSVDGPTLCYGNGDVQRFVCGFGAKIL